MRARLRKADIDFAAIHDRAKRPALARRREVVNSCAAIHNRAGGRPAPGSITIAARRLDVDYRASQAYGVTGSAESGRLRKLRRARVPRLSNTIELGRDVGLLESDFALPFPQFLKLAISITNRYFTSPFIILS